MSFAIFGIISFYLAGSLVRRITFSSLDKEIEGVRTAIEVSNEETIERNRALAEVWSRDLLGKVEFDPSASRSLQVENQVTHERATVIVPSAKIDGRSIFSSTAWVDRVAQESGLAATVFLMSDVGAVRVSTSLVKPDGDRAMGTFIPIDSPVYKSLVQGKPYAGRAQVLGNWFLTSYIPLFHDGKVVGAVFLGTQDKGAEKIIANLRAKKLLQTGYFYILNSSGLMLMHPSKEGKNVLADSDLHGRLIFKEMIEKHNGSIEYQWLNAETQKAQDKVAVFRYFPEDDWIVAASLNMAEVEAPLAELRTLALWTTTVMTFLMIGATLLFGRRVSSRFTAVLESISASTNDVHSGATETGSSSNALAESAREQSQSLQSTVSALDEIRSMTAANVANAVRTTDLSHEMADRAREGRQVIDQLTEAIGDIEAQNTNANRVLSESNRKITSIVQMISHLQDKTQVINDIVFQTKLLSFNASVEAARAGEHGRGFSVVAEEVGRLATMSGSVAEEIRKNIEESSRQVSEIIQTASGQIDELAQSSSERTRHGVEVAKVCQATFEGILGQITDVDRAVEEIRLASTEQSKGIEDISSAMHKIEKATQKSVEVAAQSQALGAVLDESSLRLKGSVESLENFLNGKRSQAA